MSHTPGPWSVSHVANSRQSRVVAGFGVEFCACANPGISTETWHANLALVAAAPELLAALKRAVETIRALHDIGLIGSPHAAEEMWALYQQSPEMQAIRAAIAKAEGRTEAAS